jgi:hypothetical protein
MYIGEMVSHGGTVPDELVGKLNSVVACMRGTEAGGGRAKWGNPGLPAPSMRSDPHHVASIAYGLKTGLRVLIVSDFEQTLDCHHYHHHCKATKLAGCEASFEP